MVFAHYLTSITLLFSVLNLQAQDPFKVVGFLPWWRPMPSLSQAEKLTHIIYFSITPNTDGSLNTNDIELDKLTSLAQASNSMGIKLLISVGGWERSQGFSTMAAGSDSRSNFARNLVQFCETYNLSGVDIDWEFPGDWEMHNHTLLIQTIRSEFSNNLLLTMDAPSGTWVRFESEMFASLDWTNIMSYDAGNPHSTYDNAVEDLEIYNDLGVPKSKLVLGVPFYGKLGDEAKSYSEIVAEFSPAPNADFAGGFNFNGPATIQRKTEHAVNNGNGGIMIWEIGHDTQNHTSLLDALHEKLIELEAVQVIGINKYVINKVHKTWRLSLPDVQMFTSPVYTVTGKKLWPESSGIHGTFPYRGIIVER